MPSEFYYQALNVGVVDANKLHRTDLEKLRLAAEEQTNLLCDAVGRAFLRPGTEHFGSTAGGAKCRLVDFVSGEEQAYALELTDNAMRIWEDDEALTRPAVVAPITNGDFASAVGWTLGTTSGTSVSIGSGNLFLQAIARGPRAYAQTQVATSSPGLEHALRIVVLQGPVEIRVGKSAGTQEYIAETTLRSGVHSLAFTMDADPDFWIEFSTESRNVSVIDSVQTESAGIVSIPTVWDVTDLSLIRYEQSLDVMFVACRGRQQQRIESRGARSWSVVDYTSDDGPFLIDNAPGILLQPSVTEGDGLLNANRAFFTTDHVGAMFRIYHEGQRIITNLAAGDTFTPTIMVTGVNEPDYNERDWTYTIAGTWVGTLRVQRSFDGEDIGFHNFRRAQTVSTVDITANATFTNDDNDDNAIAYYRIGFEAGTYTSGMAEISMTYQGGGGYGICRVTGYVSPTQVSIEILKPFYGITATKDWRPSAWSDVDGWPTSLAFDDGRLFWFGFDAFWGSVSDAYESFDEDFVGDAGPILRALAIGGRNEVRWAVSLSQLMVGTNASVASVSASSLEEILTPENTGVKRLAKVGADLVSPAALADDRALFVESSGRALYELNYNPTKGRFLATEFSKLTTDLYAAGITGMAVQNRPDQRIWVTNEADDAVCIVFEPSQEVVAPIPVSTDAAGDYIESAIVLPGYDGQDRVIMSVARLVDGVTSRRIERLALDSEAVPDDITKCLDSHVTFGAGSATVSLPHLVGRTVWAWVDGGYVEDEDGEPVEFVVSVGGTITLPSVPTVGGCSGLPYKGRYKSAKLEYGSGTSTSMMRNKTLAGIGLLMADFCRSGVKYGSEFDNADHPLFSLPATINGKPVVSDVTVGPGETEMVNPVDAQILTDSRMCIELTKPGAILALVMRFEGYGG